VAEIIIAKQRNGPVGTVKLTFLKPLTKFDNLAPRRLRVLNLLAGGSVSEVKYCIYLQYDAKSRSTRHALCLRLPRRSRAAVRCGRWNTASPATPPVL
jgi:hypothetical protein